MQVRHILLGLAMLMAGGSAAGKDYVVTDYGVKDDGKVHTREMQALIDKAAVEGGGTIVVPQGTYVTGAVFFRQGTHLRVEEGGMLKGSDDISDFPVMMTRIEGEWCKYFPGVVNVDSVDGFRLSGKGVIDGNGERYWKAFWLRRAWNPKCTNKDEMRPRLLFVSHSRNVTIEDVTLQNSPFWTSHYYKCENVKVLNVKMISQFEPVKAPSTDAIDIDVVKNMLVKGCYMEVNDDAIALKGGKGPWADTAEENGANENITIEDCTYGRCHGCLTCGSESVHNKNIVLRRINIVNTASNLLWLKMRPDTPQVYEDITVENIKGRVRNVLLVRPWTQFYDLKDRKDIPMSYSRNIVMKNIDVDCDILFNIEQRDDQYQLSDFSFENIEVRGEGLEPGAEAERLGAIENCKLKNIKINGKDMALVR